MLSYFVAPLRKAVRLTLDSAAPQQLAGGVVIGMIVGLMPKGNLIALSLCVLLFSLRVNHAVALVAAVAFSWLGTTADPLTHKIGLWALTAPAMQATYASVYNLPIGPWLSFDNTIVTGSLLLGLYIAYPVYWVTQRLLTRVEPRARDWASRSRLWQWLRAASTDRPAGAAP